MPLSLMQPVSVTSPEMQSEDFEDFRGGMVDEYLCY